MLTVSKPLTPAAAMSYYTRGNYYFESKGEWQGKFAQELGLKGEVGDEFMKILDGFNHVTGEKIVASAGAKEVKSQDGTVLRKGHCSGFDLTFSAPKAVSLLALKDERIEKIFDEAVMEAMQYVEDNLTQTRTKRFEDGKAVFDKKATSNLAWAKFNHQTSRATDPQLHSHCVVMNMTKENDTGKTKTLDWLMYGQNSKFVGQYFRNCLAEKMQNLGYEIEVTDRKQGFFTIAGIGQEVEDQFSKRTTEVEDKIEELKQIRSCDMEESRIQVFLANRSSTQIRNLYFKYGVKSQDELIQYFKTSTERIYESFTSAELKAEANLMSRGKKRKDLTMEDLRADVEKQLAKVETSLDGLQKNAKAQAQNLKDLPPTFNNLDEIFDIAMRDITEQQSAFKKEEFLMHCMKLGLGDYSGEEIMKKFENKIAKKEILAMPDTSDVSGKSGIFTTQKMIDIEKAVIDNCKNGIGQSKIKVDKEKALNFIETTHASLIEKTGFGFTPGQKDAIELIASTECQFSVIQGDAGTGKSFSMNFAREMLEADGFIVRGFAPTGKASVELSNSAKIKNCQTIDKFLIDGALKPPVSHEEFLEARKEVDRLFPLLKSEGKQSQNLLKRFHLTRAEVEKMQDYQIEAKILKHDRKLNTALTSPVKDKEVWVVDESGMAGSNKYLNIMESAKKAGAKCIFVGDRKQFASIEAGKMFMEMQDKSGIDKVIMPDVFRQKTDQTKQIVKAISMREMDFAFDMMKGRKEVKERLDDINSYQVGQMVYFQEDIKNRKGEVLAAAGSSAKVSKINEDGSPALGIYDGERNENVDTNFKLAKIADKISVYESVHENIISQETDRNERLEKVVEDYMVNTERQVKANPEKLFETMIITATNKDRSTLNGKIRDELRNSQIPEMKVSGDFEFSVLEANSLGGTSKSLADSYEEGNKIQVGSDFAKEHGIDEKELGTITGINTATNRLVVEFTAKNKDLSPIAVEIDPSRDKFSAFRESVKPFGVNDKIVFLKNDNNVNVRNGQLAIIKEIDEAGNVVADMSGEKVKFNMNEYRNIDHAYCLSEYKSQGATVSRLVWHADTKSGDVSSNSFYVAITRCTHEIALYTDDASELQEKVKREQFKYSTVDVKFEGAKYIEAQQETRKKHFDFRNIDFVGEFKSFLKGREAEPKEAPIAEETKVTKV